MWDFVFLCVVFATFVTAPGIDTSRLPLRDQIIYAIQNVNANVRKQIGAGSFSVCQRGINRAAICEATAFFMGTGSMPHLNDPCSEPYSMNASFACRTPSSVVFSLKSTPRENSVILSIGQTVYEKFTVPINDVLLINPDYVRFIRMYNWMRFGNREDDEILAVLNRAKLPPLYEIAIQLRMEPQDDVVFSVYQEELLKGFDVCELHVNRGLLCQALNVRLSGETYYIENLTECEERSYRRFSCQIQNEHFFTVTKGIAKNTIFLVSPTYMISYIVTIPVRVDSLQNKYAEELSSEIEPKELASLGDYPNPDDLVLAFPESYMPQAIDT